ncbi:response regulator transcription factor [Paenibacillus sp. FSL W8-0194]|uniref:response regulator transcription factor n=1 Tax=Paenibacillus sp. FSL W8-0194 TaxID=2921711 RepID=UPI0030D7547F
MYKVLLVDDERIILDGISQMVDWSAFRTELIGTAQNGIQAYEKIVEAAPDIVVSDIRMPGLDGLELVAKTHGTHPAVKFVLLSGYGEFEYANRAMQYGVKHYLLKPTDEVKIAEALREVTEELDRQQSRETFIRDMKRRFEKVIPHAKEQVLKEFVTNKTYGTRDLEEYRGLFPYPFDQPIRLLLCQLEGETDFEHRFAVKNIAEDVLQSTLLSTTIGDHVLILMADPQDQESFYRGLQDVRSTFSLYYKTNVTIAVSDPGPMAQARRLYRETLRCLDYRFYLDESGIITRQDALSPGSQDAEFDFDEERLILPVRSGRAEEAALALSGFIAEMKRAQLGIDMAKSYAIRQYASLIRLADPERMDEAYKRIPEIAEMESLQAIHSFLEHAVQEISRRNAERNACKYNAIVRKVIDIVEEHLGNSALSLNMVAHEMLYMNADYLGKLFKKETGEKFSNYVMRIRIQRATELMASDPDVKIFEMAERLGFGDNPQYFSQVFKKQVGCTPSEYIRKAALDWGRANA